MRKVLLLIMLMGLFSSVAFAETKVLGSWLQESTKVIFTITSEGKNYLMSQKLPSGQILSYKIDLLGKPAPSANGLKFEKRTDNSNVFFRLPESYLINEDGTLTVYYNAESSTLPPAR